MKNVLLSFSTSQRRMCWLRFGILTAFLLMVLGASNLRASIFNQINYKQLTNIQTLYIETFDNHSITSKEEYKLCRIILVSDTGTVKFDSVSIRGRGNASWGFAKKPYLVKFPKKVRLLGNRCAIARNWTLLSNGGEKLLFRNGLANYVSSLLGMPFSPAARFVDLYINGVYKGNYQISDHVQVHKKRVDIYEQEEPVTSLATDISGGYLCEVDGYRDAGETYFSSPVYGNNIRVHSPKPDVINDRQLNYIRLFVGKFEEALSGSNYTSPTKGYRAYIDSTTFLGWYLTNEICANTDIFYSIYFYKQRRESKLYLGPVWDFDLAFNDDTRRGNNGDVTNFLMADIEFGSAYFKNWFDRMKTDEWWKKAQYNTFHSLYEGGKLDRLMIGYADSIVQEMRPSIDLNYASTSRGGAGWSISAQTHLEVHLYGTYDEYVRDLKQFIVARNAYIDRQFANRFPRVFELASNCYYRIYSKDNPAYLLGPVDSTANSTNACLQGSQYSQLSQLWDLRPVGGHYMLLNVRTGLALTDEGATSTRTNILLLPPDSTNPKQLWDIIPQQVEFFNLKNVATNNVATNYNSIYEEGNPIYGYRSGPLDETNSGRMWSLRPTLKSLINTSVNNFEADIEYTLTYSRSSQKLHFNAYDVRELVFKAQIYNLDGRLVGTFRGDEEFDASCLPDGTYIISWQFAGKPHSAKFLKN